MNDLKRAGPNFKFNLKFDLKLQELQAQTASKCVRISISTPDLASCTEAQRALVGLMLPVQCIAWTGARDRGARRPAGAGRRRGGDCQVPSRDTAGVMLSGSLLRHAADSVSPGHTSPHSHAGVVCPYAAAK